MSEPWDLRDRSALEVAEADPSAPNATALRMGATLFSALPLDALLHRLE